MPPKPLTDNPALRDVVYKNRWRDVFDGTVPEGWEPTLKVSVVIAAYNSATLPLTLASLAAQDYPAELLQVVVVDDGSEPAVEVGEVAPADTTLIRVQEGQGWGRSNALRIGIEATDGDIVYWVDSDMVLFADNVRQHATWAHFIPEAATIGHKGFLEEWDLTPSQVYDLVRSDEIRDLHDLSTLHRHWSLDIYERFDDLNENSGRNYSTHMGACATVTRAVYDQTLGQDPELRLGDDTEIAYQLWQRGAVFIPVQSAQTFHLGRATVQDRAKEVTHFNNVHFANRMPYPRYRRRAENRQWKVPYVVAVVHTDAETAPLARECVDRLLNQSETDLHVVLVGPWSTLPQGRRRVLADPEVELHLLQEWFAYEGRVTLADTAPDDVFPSPYRLDVPVHVGLGSRALAKMMQVVFGEDLGLAHFFPPAGTDVAQPVSVTFTPALSRARAYVSPEVTLTEALDAVWDVEWHSSLDLGLVDLRTIELDEKIRRLDPDNVESLRERLHATRARLQKARARADAAEEELAALRSRSAAAKADVALEGLERAARGVRRRLSSR